MEVIEKMQLAGFEVLEQAEGRLWRANGPAGEKNYSMWDEKVANGCIVPGSPKWKSPMKR
jgi:hypothetical protein